MLFNSLLIQIKIKKTSALYAYIAYHCIFVYIFEKANSYMQKYLNTNCVLPFPEKVLVWGFSNLLTFLTYTCPSQSQRAAPQLE